MTKSTKVLTLLFLRKDNEVLLAMKKRGFGEGRWNGVGGKVEVGETIEAAMLREAHEEIGITPIDPIKVADIEFDEYFKGEPVLMHVHVFTSSRWNGEPVESEEMRPRWFHVDDMPYAQMWPDDPYWLPQVLEGRSVRAMFTLNENDEIISHDVKAVNYL